MSKTTRLISGVLFSCILLLGVNASLVQAQTTIMSGNSTQAWCHNFSTNLTVGSNGPEVDALYKALNLTGLTLIGFNETPGSPDFDENTAADVVTFQSKYGIRQTGYVGPITRAKLNQLYGCKTSTSPSTSTAGSAVPGCLRGALFSSTTGLPCSASTVSSVLGCAPGDNYSKLTGAPCTGAPAATEPTSDSNQLDFNGDRAIDLNDVDAMSNAILRGTTSHTVEDVITLINFINRFITPTTLPYDYNNDGKTNAHDVTLLKLYALRGRCGAVGVKTCDVNGDGHLFDIADITALTNIVNGQTQGAPNITSTGAKAANNLEAVAGGELTIYGSNLVPIGKGYIEVYIGGVQAEIVPTYDIDTSRVNIRVPTSLTAGRTYPLFVQTSAGSSNSVKIRILSNLSVTTPTVSLSVTPSTIMAGQTSLLTWSTSNAQRCVLQYGSSEETVSIASGSTVVNPSETTSYRLWCANDPGSGKDGPSAEKTVTVTVNATPSAQTSGTLTNILPLPDVMQSINAGAPPSSVVGVSAQASGGDMTIRRVDATFAIGWAGGSESDYLNKYVSDVSLYLDGIKLASMDPVNGDKDGRVWTLRFSGLTGVIKNGQTEKLYVKITPLANIGTNENGMKISAQLLADSIRADGIDGISDTYISNAISNVFTVSTIATKPTITSISPNQGTASTGATVYGTNLAGVTSVRFYNGATFVGSVSQLTTASDGSWVKFSLSTLPSGLTGALQVLVVYPSGKSNAVPFTLTSGAVLGNSTRQSSFTYDWSHDLQIGSPYLADVIALQTALMNERVYTGDITGGFYSQTFAAVKLLQEKYGIDSTGYVGPMTREKLNSLYK